MYLLISYKNAYRLVPIVKSVLFAGQQGIALRGHKDYGDLNRIDDQQINDGNFRALLRFRVDAGDKILESHMKEASGNAKYISNLVQNEIIDCIGKVIERRIIDEIKEVNYLYNLDM